MLGKEKKQLSLKGEPRSLAKKPKNKQQGLGQVFTPMPIAIRMLRSLEISTSKGDKTILDPCFGPGTFYFAIDDSGLIENLRITAYEIDSEVLKSFSNQRSGDRVDIRIRDYLLYFDDSEFDYAILNPPYVRQEWITNKNELKQCFKERFKVTVPGTSNLYVYFLVKTIMQLKSGGRFSAIVYDSWQATRYGEWLNAFIRSTCGKISIQSINNLPFDGRLIDATIITGEKRRDEFISIFDGAKGGVQEQPGTYSFTKRIEGLQTVEELFWTKRGLRLKQANFFMARLQDSVPHGATPFVKKVGLIKGYHVTKQHPEAVLLLNEDYGNEFTVKELEKRIRIALQNPEDNISILNWYGQRPDKWQYHNSSSVAPLIFNYYLRNRPKFIYNPNRQYADNFYGLRPNDNVDPKAWLAVLNSTLVAIGILEQARNQGGGLAKLQLYEFRRVKVPSITSWGSSSLSQLSRFGQELIDNPRKGTRIIEEIDNLIQSILKPDYDLLELYDAVDEQAREPKHIF